MGEMPPNPSRLANGQAPQPFTTCKWTRPHNPSRLAPPPPQPFATCKWTRVAGPPTLHDLGAASKWTRVGSPPNPDLQMDKGWGPTLHDSPPQPFATCKWKGWGPPNPSRLANRQRLDKGWGYQHCLWTRVGPPQPFAIWGDSPNKLYRFNIRFQADQAPCPKIDKSMTGPFGPERTPTQTSNFVWTSIGASKPSNA